MDKLLLETTISNEIVHKIIAKDREACQMLYNLFYSKMMAICRRYTKNADDAKDLMQEGFIRVFENIQQYQFKGSFEGWMRRVFVTTAINYVHKNYKKEIQYEDNNTLLEYHHNQNNPNAEEEESTLYDHFIHYNSEVFLNIFKELPFIQQIIFNMVVIDEMPYSEISRILSVKENSCRVYFMRAKEQLKNKLKALYEKEKNK